MIPDREDELKRLEQPAPAPYPRRHKDMESLRRSLDEAVERDAAAPEGKCCGPLNEDGICPKCGVDAKQPAPAPDVVYRTGGKIGESHPTLYPGSVTMSWDEWLDWVEEDYTVTITKEGE